MSQNTQDFSMYISITVLLKYQQWLGIKCHFFILPIISVRKLQVAIEAKLVDFHKKNPIKSVKAYMLNIKHYVSEEIIFLSIFFFPILFLHYGFHGNQNKQAVGENKNSAECGVSPACSLSQNRGKPLNLYHSRETRA